MSDVIDVQNTLVNIVAAAVYPNGTGQPSVGNCDIRVYPGWPTASKLDADLNVGIAHITVFPTNTESNKTRYPRDWVPQAIPPASITVALSGQAITIGGAVPTPFVSHNVMAMVNGLPYVYPVVPTDTINSIAAALAALIPGAAASGATITTASTSSVTAARVGVVGTSIREIRRQERVFQITVWANTPALRDTIGSAFDIALANTEFLTMPDGYGARLTYRSSHVVDALQKAKLYRREFMYSVEYATTETRSDAQITQGQLNVALQDGNPIRHPAVHTTYF
jgi:hypothetical protein